MTRADDLLRQANTLAEKIQRQRRSPRSPSSDGRELAAMETRLTSLWAAIRAARAGVPLPDDERLAPRTRPKWD